MSATSGLFLLRRLSSGSGPPAPPPSKVLNLIKGGIQVPDYALDGVVDAASVPPQPVILDDDEALDLRRACKLAKTVLAECDHLVRPGVTTQEIDEALHQKIVSGGAYPSPLNFKGFPKSVATSVNSVAAHGVPDECPLERGDLVNVDVTVFLNGFHGDCSKSFLVGGDDSIGDWRASALLSAGLECLFQGISACGPGIPFR